MKPNFNALAKFVLTREEIEKVLLSISDSVNYIHRMMIRVEITYGQSGTSLPRELIYAMRQLNSANRHAADEIFTAFKQRSRISAGGLNVPNVIDPTGQAYHDLVMEYARDHAQHRP